MERQEIKLTYESLIALLQGKEFHLKTMDHHFVFHSPFDGVWVTHEQLAQIRYNDEMRILGLLEELGRHEEER